MSDGTEKRKSRPGRLALLMIAGTIAGVVLSPSAGNAFDVWGAGLLIGGMLGALAGLVVELCLQRRIAVEFVVAAVVLCSLLAIFWAMRH
jgi:hypothetical protein